MKKERKSLRRSNLNPVTIIVFVFLALYVLSLAVMYFWAFGASLKTNTQFSIDNIKWVPGWPWEWAWDNYPKVIEKIKVPTQYGDVYFETLIWNSFLYTVIGALINNFTIWLAAFLITRFKRFRLSKFIFAANIVLMTIPVVGTLPSALAVFRTLNWYNNYNFIIFNSIGFTGVYLLYYCAFINGLGNEYYEAAYIDGAGNFTCMTKIAFPLTMQMFAVILLLTAITRWNDYMTMVVWMPDYPTLAYGIYSVSVSNATEMSFPPLQISACVVLMIPMLIVFFAFQDVIMGNLRLGALKG